MVHRLVRVLGGIIGPAVLEEEAWTAVLRCVSGRTNLGTPLGKDEHLRNRLLVGWVRTGGEAGESRSDLWRVSKLIWRVRTDERNSLQSVPQSCD